MYKGIAPCMFIGLERVKYLVHNFVMLGYVKVFDVWVSASGE